MYKRKGFSLVKKPFFSGKDPGSCCFFRNNREKNLLTGGEGGNIIPLNSLNGRSNRAQVHQRAGTEWESGGNVNGEKSPGEVLRKLEYGGTRRPALEGKERRE